MSHELLISIYNSETFQLNDRKRSTLNRFFHFLMLINAVPLVELHCKALQCSDWFVLHCDRF